MMRVKVHRLNGMKDGFFRVSFMAHCNPYASGTVEDDVAVVALEVTGNRLLELFPEEAGMGEFFTDEALQAREVRPDWNTFNEE